MSNPRRHVNRVSDTHIAARAGPRRVFLPPPFDRLARFCHSHWLCVGLGVVPALAGHSLRTGRFLRLRNLRRCSRFPPQQLSLIEERLQAPLANLDLRAEIEQAPNDAAHVALEETVFRYCGYTRIRNAEGWIAVLPTDIAVAMFQHGTSSDASTTGMAARRRETGRRGSKPKRGSHWSAGRRSRRTETGRWRARRGRTPTSSIPAATRSCARS